MVALASLTLLGAPIAAEPLDAVVPGGHDVVSTALGAGSQAQAANLVRDASRRSGITAEGAYNAYELGETGPGGEVWIRNRLVDGQTGAGAAMPSERNDGQLGGVPLNSERYVVWYERFTELPTTSQDRWQVVGPEIHGPNVSAFPQAVLMLEVGPDKRRRLNANAGRSSARYRDIGPIELGRTYAMKMHVRLSAGSDGIIEIWRDGEKVVTLTGATIDQAIAGSYWKEANYRNAAIDGPMTHDFSSLRIYDGDVSLPAGGPAPPPPPAPTPPPVAAPPRTINVIAQDSFEGPLPGRSGSAFRLVTGPGNRFSTVTAPRTGVSKAGSRTSGTTAAAFEQAGRGNRVAIGKSYAPRRDVSASVRVYVSRNALANGRNRSILRITSGPGATASPRHEVGIHRSPQGTMHWAIWSVDRNGRYTYAKLGSAPKVGTWQTLGLQTQWDRAAARARLVIDGGETLSPAAVDLSGVRANNFEAGLNYSNPADKALLLLDDVKLTDGPLSGSRAGRRDSGTTSSEIVGAFSRGMLQLRAPKGVAPGRHGIVSFRTPSAMRVTVSSLKGARAVSRITRTSKAGLNRIAIRAPRRAGTYTVRLAFPSVSVAAPMRVGV